MNDVTDKDLLRTIMFLKEWTQDELAGALGFNRSNISKIINEKQHLTIERREYAENLLRECEKKPLGK